MYVKNLIIVLFILIVCKSLHSQDSYWVFFTDKANTKFDPYEYFDQKAIDRRLSNNLSLYDISDYPLNSEYVKIINGFSSEVIGETRWFNAIAVVASEENINHIKHFDFVSEVLPITYEMEPASNNYEEDIETFFENLKSDNVKLSAQIERFQGKKFVENGINGEGLRIAVFDGGFPDVDKHMAFKHLRDNNKIVKTWNFPKNREDVYGWNRHGTMVLTCIAGMSADSVMYGLATGAEFLLARTEVNVEPLKEEVWWLQAVEWADKNGADIINSSLGYGITRHYPYEMDGKTTLVTRAANMAASKGILVCNSAGNEGSSKNWRIIAAPADADSILTVGGINSTEYKNTVFSSFGPTADGRLKPNVCAFGYANVASPGKDINKISMSSGTSFSSPLVAGFVACAWQTRRELTAMEMKKEIEKSADLYPYFDYVYGYGIPQASYFTDITEKNKNKSFEFIIDSAFIYIKPLTNETDMIFYHIENENGILDRYIQVKLSDASADDFEKSVIIDKHRLLDDKTLRVFFNGYVDTYKLNDDEVAFLKSIVHSDVKAKLSFRPQYTILMVSDVTKQKQTKYGVNANYYFHLYFSYGMMLPVNIEEYSVNYGKTNSFNLGLRFKYNVKKWYGLGANLEINSTNYRVSGFPAFMEAFYFPMDLPDNYIRKYQKIDIAALNLELYQRFRLLPTEGVGLGVYLDMGIYGSWAYKNRYQEMYQYGDSKVIQRCRMDAGDLNWGVRARLGYGVFSVFGQYRVSDVLNNVSDLPRFMIGVELGIPLGM